jgi:hypothetical protein
MKALFFTYPCHPRDPWFHNWRFENWDLELELDLVIASLSSFRRLAPLEGRGLR